MDKEKLQEILLDFMQEVWEKEDLYYDANDPKWHVKLVDDFIKEQQINLNIPFVSNCEEVFNAARQSIKGDIFLNTDENGDYFSAFIPKYPFFKDYLDDK